MNHWHIANGIVSLAGALFMSWIILHPRIHEGLAVKFGLIVMTFSLAATAYLSLTQSDDWTAYWRSAFWLRFGLIVTFLGIVARAFGWFAAPKRSISDWCDRHSQLPHRPRGTDCS